MPEQTGIAIRIPQVVREQEFPGTRGRAARRAGREKQNGSSLNLLHRRLEGLEARRRRRVEEREGKKVMSGSVEGKRGERAET